MTAIGYPGHGVLLLPAGHRFAIHWARKHVPGIAAVHAAFLPAGWTASRQAGERRTDMAQDGHRQVSIARTAAGKYTVTKDTGGTISVGTGSDGEFTPVELLLAAIGACTAIDVDILTSRRAEPTEFTIEVGAEKVRDQRGSRLQDIEVTFRVRFPAGTGGDAARDLLPGAVRRSHNSLCTVSRTVELGTPVANVIA